MKLVESSSWCVHFQKEAEKCHGYAVACDKAHVAIWAQWLTAV